MGSISGFCNPTEDFSMRYEKYTTIANEMSFTLQNRGPDKSSLYFDKHVFLAHNKLSLLSEEPDAQPITSQCGKYEIVFSGELFNAPELTAQITSLGYPFQTKTDADIVLTLFCLTGAECCAALSGNFAFVIWDKSKNRLFACRDRFGIKPLFYTIRNNTFVFASEIKALFKYPGITPILDSEGLSELFGLFPSRTEGFGLFKDICEIPYGSFGVFDASGFTIQKYWDLTTTEHRLSYAETVEQVSFLLRDSIKRQLKDNVPICAFLSGGIDSSIITGVIADQLAQEGRLLDTFSFDFKDNDKYFQSNSFQVDRDNIWAAKMSDLFSTNHLTLECDIPTLTHYLFKAVDAKDMPGMADVDASLLYFCSQVKLTHTVAFTGECADEIFGGYPWFHSKDSFETNSFPWIRNMDYRKSMLSTELLNTINLEQHVANRYEQSLSQVKKLPSESKEDMRRREISYLNLKWFMTTLLDRMDRMSMYSGLNAKVPFADHRIVELLWNVPWEMKCNGTPKSLLRDAFRDLLPEELINRKKSPYPKTYHPEYEKKLKQMLKDVIENPTSPILPFLNKAKVYEFINAKSDYGKPWFGQLMAGPQLAAFYLQINYWLKKYNISIQ